MTEQDEYPEGDRLLDRAASSAVTSLEAAIDVHQRLRDSVAHTAGRARMSWALLAGVGGLWMSACSNGAELPRCFRQGQRFGRGPDRSTAAGQARGRLLRHLHVELLGQREGAAGIFPTRRSVEERPATAFRPGRAAARR